MNMITIKEAAAILGCRDRRTVFSFCKANNIALLSLLGLRGKFVIKEELDFARMKAAIKYVKTRYGEDALSNTFSSIMQVQSEVMTSLEQGKNRPISHRTNYRLKGKHEISCFERLTRILSEL